MEYAKQVLRDALDRVETRRVPDKWHACPNCVRMEHEAIASQAASLRQALAILEGAAMSRTPASGCEVASRSGE